MMNQLLKSRPPTSRPTTARTIGPGDAGRLRAQYEKVGGRDVRPHDLEFELVRVEIAVSVEQETKRE